MKALVEEFLYNRHPLKVSITFSGIDRPTLKMELINQTPKYKLIVHEVRIHTGTKENSLAIILSPFEKITIQPKDRSDWTHTFGAAGSRFLTVQTMEEDEKMPNGPPVSGLNEIYDRIIERDPNETWIEIDFNEYNKREFMRGKLSSEIGFIKKLCERHRRV